MKKSFLYSFVYILVITFLFFPSLRAVSRYYPYQLSVCTVFQNEAPYLKEWIEFHRLVGVDHFYLFNNLSTDHYQEVLKPYIKKGIVELIDWPYDFKEWKEWDDIQVRALQEGCERAYGKTKWLAFLDCDEFLFPTQCNNLSEFLKQFESQREVGGICVSWVVFGTSNVAKIPDDKLLIETLVMSSGSGSDHFKSIVRPEKVSAVVNPHYVIYKKGYSAFTPSNRPMQPPYIEIDLIRINHYWSRDEFYLNTVKIPRRIKWGTPAEVCQLWGTSSNNFHDTAIFRFIEPLRKKIFKN